MSGRFLDYATVFDHEATRVIVIGGGVMLLAAPLIVLALAAPGWIAADSRRVLMARCLTWIVLGAVMFLPIAAGPGWVIVGVTILALLCYREYARLTGLFRHRAISATVAVGIILVGFASLDHWYAIFVALGPLFVAIIPTVGLIRDEPKGYIQRTALGVFAVALFGVGLGHLGYLANDPLYRPMLLWLLLCVEINDVFAFLCGKTFGHRRLAPNTSPNKTIGGALGALVATTAVTAGLGHLVFAGTTIDRVHHLIALGVLVSVAGQCGDLMLSSVKRDLGVKDTSNVLPGHGGLLDRFDSILLAAPAVFHYLGYFKADGIGLNEPTRLITGG